VKIAVVGVGAMGSVYAGLLGAAGNDLWALDTDLAQVEAIRAHGLHVEGASGDRVVRISATSDPHEVGETDLVVIATKAMHAQAAARSVEPLLGDGTTVLTIQNGLGAADVVADVVGPERLMIGVAGGFGASIVEPGHVHHHGMELLRLGEREGPVNERTEQVAEAWRQAGFKVKTFDDIDKLIWEKFICNVCFSGVCGVLELTVGEVLGNPHAWPIASRCAQEALDVARASGISLDIDDCERYVHDFGRAIPGARPSLLLDLLAGRRSEIEWINGAVVREGRAAGVAAPTNELITSLVLAKEAANGTGSAQGSSEAG
jgi:2-dehydropantoate 2-reductase